MLFYRISIRNSIYKHNPAISPRSMNDLNHLHTWIRHLSMIIIHEKVILWKVRESKTQLRNTSAHIWTGCFNKIIHGSNDTNIACEYNFGNNGAVFRVGSSSWSCWSMDVGNFRFSSYPSLKIKVGVRLEKTRVRDA